MARACEELDVRGGADMPVLEQADMSERLDAEALDVTPDDVLVLRPLLREGAVEDYLYITTEGETQCRTESPYFAWRTNAGQMDRDYSYIADEGDLDEISGRLKINRLTLPNADELPPQSDLWLVARDRRGGIDWRRFDLVSEQ